MPNGIQICENSVGAKRLSTWLWIWELVFKHHWHTVVLHSQITNKRAQITQGLPKSCIWDVFVTYKMLFYWTVGCPKENFFVEFFNILWTIAARWWINARQKVSHLWTHKQKSASTFFFCNWILHIWNGFYTSKISLLSPLIIGSKFTFISSSGRWLPTI